jgi:hypothetical protein
MADNRTDEQKLRGVLPLRWGGEFREIPTLKRGPAREWKDKLAEMVGEVGGLSVGAIESISAAGNMAGDRMLDLVMAYDASGLLGDREWVDAHVDDLEVYAAFRSLLEVSYPFVTDLRAALAEVRGMGAMAVPNAVPSASPASTNGRSPRGVTTPRK